MRLYELRGRDPEHRFSPYVWRTKLALAHKGLAYESVPLRFVEIAQAPFAGTGARTVPVLEEDDGRFVVDSWEIARHLEDRFPERPSLFGGEAGCAHARFINAWVDRTLVVGLFPLLVADIWKMLDPADQEYFRESREARLGCRLEDAAGDVEARVKRLRRALSPLRATLRAQPFLGGAEPSYADHAAIGPFVWASCCSDLEILEEGDPVRDWRARMFDLFDGLVRRAVRARAA